MRAGFFQERGRALIHFFGTSVEAKFAEFLFPDVG
jgi:hypothetical protein